MERECNIIKSDVHVFNTAKVDFLRVFLYRVWAVNGNGQFDKTNSYWPINLLHKPSN